MPDLIGPYDAAVGWWTQDEWYRVARSWAPTGILGTPATAITSGQFAVTSSGLNITVAVGTAWIRGGGWGPAAVTPITVTANPHASFSRRDRIVMRRDLAAQTTTLEVKLGTASGTPTAPALTLDDNGIWEEPICSFLAPANSGTTLTGFLDERRWIDPSGGGYVPALYSNQSGTVATVSGGGAEVVVSSSAFNKQAMLHVGRSYRVRFLSLLNSDTGGVTVNVNARAVAGATAPTASATVIGTDRHTMPPQTGSTGRERVRIDETFTPSATGVHTFAIFIDASGGSISLINDSRGITDLLIADVGAAPAGLLAI